MIVAVYWPNPENKIGIRAERSIVNWKANVVMPTAAGFWASCSSTPDAPQVVKTEKPFVSAGSIEMQLDGGNYAVRPAAADSIRVSFGGNTGNSTAELTTNGAHANLVVKDTPHSNFRRLSKCPRRRTW